MSNTTDKHPTTWEKMTEPQARFPVERFAVPGGWLYVTCISGSWTDPTFVPSPMIPATLSSLEPVERFEKSSTIKSEGPPLLGLMHGDGNFEAPIDATILTASECQLTWLMFYRQPTDAFPPMEVVRLVEKVAAGRPHEGKGQTTPDHLVIPRGGMADQVERTPLMGGGHVDVPVDPSQATLNYGAAYAKRGEGWAERIAREAKEGARVYMTWEQLDLALDALNLSALHGGISLENSRLANHLYATRHPEAADRLEAEARKPMKTTTRVIVKLGDKVRILAWPAGLLTSEQERSNIGTVIQLNGNHPIVKYGPGERDWVQCFSNEVEFVSRPNYVEVNGDKLVTTSDEWAKGGGNGDLQAPDVADEATRMVIGELARHHADTDTDTDTTPNSDADTDSDTDEGGNPSDLDPANDAGPELDGSIPGSVTVIAHPFEYPEIELPEPGTDPEGDRYAGPGWCLVTPRGEVMWIHEVEEGRYILQQEATPQQLEALQATAYDTTEKSGGVWLGFTWPELNALHAIIPATGEVQGDASTGQQAINKVVDAMGISGNPKRGVLEWFTVGGPNRPDPEVIGLDPDEVNLILDVVQGKPAKMADVEDLLHALHTSIGRSR